ncbi:MAG: MFS transporter [Candidatus Tectomicrobia bacterium]|uniref:MFS transporter n=1 Tax=Tectimicrobiota bacterium TaxID=2528274 RepID=A0A932GPD8_UNCTE|nr:MFS transporter [Candidatus Tectomicrobia bacterium]
MGPYDMAALSVALPKIGEDLHASLATLSWIPMASLVPSAVLQVLCGRLADIRGRKSLYSLGVGIFALTSMLSSLSQSLAQLIALRVCLGIAGALLWSNSAAIVTESFPEHERGKALGLYVMSLYLGLSVGPVLGGFLTQQGGWRSIFLLNVAVGAVTFYLIRTRLPDLPVRQEGLSFDWGGALLFAVFLISLLLALTFVQITGWSSLRVALLLALSILALGTFISFESHTSGEPMLEISLFTRNRLFRAANTAAMMNYMAIFGAPFLLSMYLQGVLHYNPSRTGMLLIPQPLAMTVLSPLAGKLSDRIDSGGHGAHGNGDGSVRVSQQQRDSGIGEARPARGGGGHAGHDPDCGPILEFGRHQHHNRQCPSPGRFHQPAGQPEKLHHFDRPGSNGAGIAARLSILHGDCRPGASCLSGAGEGSPRQFPERLGRGLSR